MTESPAVDGDPLDAIIEEFIGRLRRGDKPSVEEYARRFPAMAERLNRLLPALLELESNASPKAAVEEIATADYSPQAAANETTPQMRFGREGYPEPNAMLGRFRIIKPLGEGGMGSVFVAEDVHLGRLVALKIPQLAKSDDGDVWSRFHREAKAAAGLSHPSICPVYGFGEAEGLPWLAMAYVRGRLLSDRLATGPLGERETAEIVRAIASALDYAHRQGVIHRDLKPQNVMLDESGRPIVLDFGLARQTLAIGETATQSGLVMGTPAYISPEQAEGRSRAVGPPADIYSLGVMLYEMLTGRRPFQGSPAELLGKHLYQSPAPPADVRSGADAKLAALALEMLAKAPGDRPASMAAVASRLDAWLGERDRLADAEDAGGRLTWRLPIGLAGGGIALLYAAWWFATPMRDAIDVLINSAFFALFGLPGLLLLGLAARQAIARWKR